MDYLRIIAIDDYFKNRETDNHIHETKYEIYITETGTVKQKIIGGKSHFDIVETDDFSNTISII